MTVHLGYDAASPFDTAVLAGVSASYAAPAWIGRYLEQIQGTSSGLTIPEVAAIHARGLALCLVYNGATPNDVTSVAAVGRANAAVAVRHAQALATPTGVALFVDIEAGWAPSVAFLTGWIEGVHNGGYVPGAYLNAQDANHIAPVLAAIEATGIQMALWSSEPEFNAWHEEALTSWYDFGQTPLGPHADLVVLHQYGENEQAGAVDLDIASDAGMAVLWGPAPLAPPAVHYPYSARVITPGMLKTAPNHDSSGAIDGRHRPVYLEKGAELSVRGPSVPDPNKRDHWLPIELSAPEQAVHGFLLANSISHPA